MSTKFLQLTAARNANGKIIKAEVKEMVRKVYAERKKMPKAKL